MSFEYAIQIVWSTEDSAYIAVVSDLPGCMADGKTPEQALANARQIIKEWIEVAKEEKRQIPPPLSAQDIGRMIRQQMIEEQKLIMTQLEKAAKAMMPEMIDHLKQQLQAKSPARNPWARGGIPYDDLESIKAAS